MRWPSPFTKPPKDEPASGSKPSSSSGPATAVVRPVSSRLKTLLLGLGCIALSALVTFGAFEIIFPVRIPAAMRGKWVVVEGKDLQGATLEFFADGSMIGTFSNEGKEVTIKGRVKVEGNLFRVTTPGPAGGVEVTDSEEILDLTDRRLVVQDKRGELIIMERPTETRAATAGGAR